MAKLKATGTTLYNLYKLVSPEVLTPKDITGSWVGSERLEPLRLADEVFALLHEQLKDLHEALHNFNILSNGTKNAQGEVDEAEVMKMYEKSTLKELEQKEWELEVTDDQLEFVREVVRRLGFTKINNRAMLSALLAL